MSVFVVNCQQIGVIIYSTSIATEGLVTIYQFPLFQQRHAKRLTFHTVGPYGIKRICARITTSKDDGIVGRCLENIGIGMSLHYISNVLYLTVAVVAANGVICIMIACNDDPPV